ncbi:MAG: hypothetical protein MZU91_14840 [Desulfosudis oleivorans]|nr:hypothetical protein [Desulfosudis oleivorans]
MSFTSRDTAAAADIFDRMLQRQGLHHRADAGRQHQRRRLHAGLCRHDPVQHGGRGGGHRRLHRGHGFLRSPGLQALQGLARCGRPRSCASSTSTASTTPTSTRSSCRPAT